MKKLFEHIRFGKSFNRRGVLYRSFLLITITVIIPVIALEVILYTQTSSILTSQVQEIDRNLLNRTRGNLEIVLEQLAQQAVQLADSDYVTELLLFPDNMEWENLRTCVSELDAVVTHSPYVVSAYAYMGKNHTLVTSDKRYYEADSFFDSGLWPEAYSQMEGKFLWTKPRTMQTLSGEKLEAISIIAISPTVTSRRNGAVVFNVDLNALQKDFLFSKQREDSNIFILNKNFLPIIGTPSPVDDTAIDYSWILSTPEETVQIQQVGGQKVLSSYVYLEVLDAYLVCSTQYEASFSRFSSALQGIAFYGLLIALVSLFLSAFTSLRIYTPVKTLVEDVVGSAEHSSGKNEYELIETAYSYVRHEKGVLTERIEQMSPLLTERFFIMLLLGHIDASEPPIQTYTSQFGDSAYSVLTLYNSSLAKAAGEQELFIHDVASMVLENHTNVHYMCIKTTPQIITVIIHFLTPPTSMEAREFLIATQKQIQRQLSQEKQTDWLCSFGHYCESIYELPDSYHGAVKDLQFKLFQRHGQEVSETEYEDPFYNPVLPLANQLQQDIMRAQDCSRVLDKLFTQLRSELPLLTQFHLRQIMQDILNRVIEALVGNKLNIELVYGAERNLFQELSRKEELDEIKGWLQDICTKAEEAIAQSNRNQVARKVSVIVEYMEQNYSKDISLNDVSEYVNLSSAYVSRIFKEHIGQGFVEYLNQYRVQQAQQLLADTQILIKEVGFNCGFNNMQAFVRVFKRYAGVTPTQYRQQHYSY